MKIESQSAFPAPANKLIPFPSLLQWILTCLGSYVISYSYTITHSWLLLVAHHPPLKCVPLKDRDIIIYHYISSTNNHKVY